MQNCNDNANKWLIAYYQKIAKIKFFVNEGRKNHNHHLKGNSGPSNTAQSAKCQSTTLHCRTINSFVSKMSNI